MTRSTKLSLVLIGLLTATSPSNGGIHPTQDAVDVNFYYRLTNSFLGETRALDTFSNGKNQPFMGKTGPYSGQFWKFTPLGNGRYRITNSFLGDGRALDTYSNGENKPFMGTTGPYSGQSWKLTPVGNGFFRLTNDFLGATRSLDTYGNGENQPFMGDTGNYSGQIWKLTRLSRIHRNVVPRVVSPAARARVDNGAIKKAVTRTWHFQWTAVPGATEYQLYVVGPNSVNPLVNRMGIVGTTYSETRSSGYVAHHKLYGWSCKVRAKVNGMWMPWSAERKFNVKPPRKK